MNEKSVIKSSLVVFIVGLLLCYILDILIKDNSYLYGFVIGYLLNLVIFYMTIKTSESILNLSPVTPLVILGIVLKLIIYSIGFYIAIKIEWINILGVFIGYMSIKIAIYLEGYKNKGGDIND